MIIEWLLRNVKVKKDTVLDAMSKMDEDGDGYFSLGELIAAIRRIQ